MSIIQATQTTTTNLYMVVKGYFWISEFNYPKGEMEHFAYDVEYRINILSKKGTRTESGHGMSTTSNTDKFLLDKEMESGLIIDSIKFERW